MIERRKEPRVKVSFPVECSFLPERNYFYTVSKDLSMGGVKILVNDFIAKGNLLKLNINLINKVIDLKAKVVWCNKERMSDRYSAGLQFVEINEKKRKSLATFLNTIFHS
jgi:c-di-GMP-binding flagellar brake protein YcgR